MLDSWDNECLKQVVNKMMVIRDKTNRVFYDYISNSHATFSKYFPLPS